MNNRYEVTMHLIPNDQMKACLSSWSHSEIKCAANAVVAVEIFLESDKLKAELRKRAGINVPLEKGGINIKVVSLGAAAEAVPDSDPGE